MFIKQPTDYFNSDEFILKQKYKKMEIIALCNSIIDVDNNIIMDEDITDEEIPEICINLIITLYYPKQRNDFSEKDYMSFDRKHSELFEKMINSARSDINDTFKRMIKTKLKRLCESKYYEFKYIHFKVRIYDMPAFLPMYFSYKKYKDSEYKIYYTDDVESLFDY